MIDKLFRRKKISDILDQLEARKDNGLVKNLTLRDLTFFGIAGIVGAGIFSTIGNASAAGGPAVSLLFVFTAVACVFSAMCYAQFASTVPVSGSAYTYSFVAFGELIAWVIGWTLIMEYAIGNIAVAISWSDYFTGFMNGLLANLGWKIPEYFTMDYLSAYRGYSEVGALLISGTEVKDIPNYLIEAHAAWILAPQIGGFRIIADIPALVIVFLITWLVFVGIQESKTASNALVVLKLCVIFLVIVAGAFYIEPENWSPFAPNGLTGVLKGVSAVFFAYIGFDAISTTAEECKNPQRDLPKSMIYALGICTLLYIVIALVLTGMVNYKNLAVGDPLAFVFEYHGVHWISGIVAVSAIIAIAGVLLVFQIGQPRIWMSMSRDGLLPKKFSSIHPKYKTPWFATIVTGFLVAIPALFMNLQEVTDLTSIGTLFAFILVCAGVLELDKRDETKLAKFKIPYVNAGFIMPALFIFILAIIHYFDNRVIIEFFNFGDQGNAFSWDVFKHKIPMLVFIGLSIHMTIRSFLKKLSLIPVLGLITNFYLMTELGLNNWIGFSIWLILGLLIYFGYGIISKRFL
jgi:amino acid transporter